MIQGPLVPAQALAPTPASAKLPANGNVLPFEPLVMALAAGCVPGVPAVPASAQSAPGPLQHVHSGLPSLQPPLSGAPVPGPSVPRPADACFPIPDAPPSPPSVEPQVVEPQFDEPPFVELHLEHGGGRVEVVSVPWRLASTDRLSQRVDATAVAPLGITPMPVPTLPAAPVAAAPRPEAISDGAVAGMPAPGGRTAAAGLPGEAVRTPAPTTSRAREQARDAAQAFAPPAEPWRECLVRWLEREGVDPSLWVRDFRLDPQQARALADALQSLARERHVALRRIVVNGREAWHAPGGHDGQGA